MFPPKSRKGHPWGQGLRKPGAGGRIFMNIVLAAILCGVVAVLYGLFTSRSVLAASPGNEKMQEIAGAIQEGAKAYLGRQYRTIAIVGVIVAAIVAVFLGPVRSEERRVGKSVSVRVDLGGRRIIKKKTTKSNTRDLHQ